MQQCGQGSLLLISLFSCCCLLLIPPACLPSLPPGVHSGLRPVPAGPGAHPAAASVPGGQLALAGAQVRGLPQQLHLRVRCLWLACSLRFVQAMFFTKVCNSTPRPGAGHAIHMLPRLSSTSPAAAGAPSGCMWRAILRASCWSSCPAAQRRASRVWRGERGGERGKDG